MKKFSLVKVDWLDAYAHNEGTRFEEKDFDGLKVKDYLGMSETVGWLIREDKDGMLIASTVIDGQFDFIAIPKKMIIKKIKLK